MVRHILPPGLPLLKSCRPCDPNKWEIVITKKVQGQVVLGELDAIDFHLEVLGAPISNSCFLLLLQSSSIHTASWALVRALLKRKLGTVAQ